MSWPGFIYAQTPQGDNPRTDTQDNAQVLKKLDQLVEQNSLLEKQVSDLLEQNRELLDQIKILRGILVTEPSKASEPKEKNSEPLARVPPLEVASQQVDEDDADSGLPVAPN